MLSALQLAGLGIRRLQLIDVDTVDLTNVTSQRYHQCDSGQMKVLATEQAAKAIDPTIDVIAITDRFRPRLALGEVVFCCVDSISARAAIWRSVQRTTPFWCNGRIPGEVMRFLSVANGCGSEQYAATLFDQSETQPGTVPPASRSIRQELQGFDAASIQQLDAKHGC